MKKFIILLLTLCMCLSIFTACDEAQHTNTHDHDLTKVTAVAPTCEMAGNSEYYTCSCGKYFSDADAKTEIAKDSWVLSATGHTYATTWSYNETHHWKEATCEHKTEKSEYAEHAIVDNKCSCGWTATTSTINVVGKTFKFVSSDTTLSTITYNSGNVLFKADGTIEIYLELTLSDGSKQASTAVGTYVQNDDKIVFSLTGTRVGEQLMEYPAEMADSYKNLNGVIEGNKVILAVPYNISETETGVERLTFELAQ